jgi:hypothetical protein
MILVTVPVKKNANQANHHHRVSRQTPCFSVSKLDTPGLNSSAAISGKRSQSLDSTTDNSGNYSLGHVGLLGPAVSHSGLR